MPNYCAVLPSVEPTAVSIQVRASDTLLWSFPVWLICHGADISVRLCAMPEQPAAQAHGWRHLPPVCHVGAVKVSQLMAVLEYFNELWPSVGIWPTDPVHRARARVRDACAGIVSMCTGSSPFLLSLPEAMVCADPVLVRTDSSMRASVVLNGSAVLALWSGTGEVGWMLTLSEPITDRLLGL